MKKNFWELLVETYERDIEKLDELYTIEPEEESESVSEEEPELINNVSDAIPIEWIKGYITPFQVHHDSLSEELKENDGAGWVVDVLETMLREWEKENEMR